MKFSVLKKRLSFTLVELLITIVIMVILASLLFPALGQARKMARNSVCLSNLKQFGMGFSMYSNDYNGWLPQYINTEYREWDYQIMPYVNYKTQNYIIANRFKEFSIFHCPSGKPSPSCPSVWSEYRSRGYSFNLSIATNYENSGKISSLKSPGNTTLMFDFAASGCELATFSSQSNIEYISPGTSGNSYTTYYISYRHTEKCNTLFSDGHGQSLKKGTFNNRVDLPNWIPAGTRWYNDGTIY